MTWTVVVHPAVEKDLKSISSHHKKIILNTCQKKLSRNPEGYGKPLGGKFHGLWKLKVLDYRIIYKIEKLKIIVLIIKIGFRRNNAVYLSLEKTLEQIDF